MGRKSSSGVYKINDTKARDIYLLFQYFSRESKKHKNQYMSHLKCIKKTAEIMQVSVSAVRNTVRNKGVISENKKYKQFSKIDDFDKEFIRNTVHSFYLQKKLPSIPNIQQRISGELKVSKTTLRRALLELGFCFRKSTDNRQVVTERTDIVNKRIEYLIEIEKYRNEGYNIVYLDETWVNQNHHKNYGWLPKCQPFGKDVEQDRTVKLPKFPSGKGKRLIVLHCGSKDGFIPGCELVFVGQHKDGDYHSEMNSKLFLDWFENTLCISLDGPSVIILDNASYHNTKVESSWCPNMNTRKDAMLDWLHKRNIQHSAIMTKVQLYELIKRNKPPIYYKTDDIAHKYGHLVLRTPVKHCILNPIELIWAQVKDYVAERNITYKLNDVKKLVYEAFDSVTKDKWEKAVVHTIGIENQYRKSDNIRDQLDPFIIHLDSDEGDSEIDYHLDSETDSYE